MYICIKNHYIYVMASRKLKQSNQTELMCYSLSTKKSHVHTVKYLLYLKVFPCRSNSIFSGLKSTITHIRGQNISELFIGFCFLYLHVKQKPLYMKQPLKSVPKKQLLLKFQNRKTGNLNEIPKPFRTIFQGLCQFFKEYLSSRSTSNACFYILYIYNTKKCIVCHVLSIPR